MRTSALRCGALACGLAVAVLVAGCQEATEINGRPVETTIEAPVETRHTHVQVAESFDPKGVLEAVDAVLPSGLVSLSSRLRGAVCAGGATGEGCRDGRLTGTVLRDGPVELVSDGDGLAVRIPVRYELRLQPSDKAMQAAEAAGRLAVVALLEVGLDEAWQPTFGAPARFRWSEPASVKLLGVPIELGGEVEAALARQLKRLSPTLLAPLPFAALRARTQAVWRHLHAPQQVTAEPATWLRGEPVAVRFGGLAADAARPGKAQIRSVIVTRLRQFLTERPIPLLPRPLPSPARGGDEPAEGLPLSFDIAYHAFEAAAGPGVAAIAPAGSRLSFSRLELFPAGARTGLAFALAADRQTAWWPVRGRAHYLGTFEVPDGGRTLQLGDLELFDPAAVPPQRKSELAILQDAAVIEQLRQALRLDIGGRLDALDAMVAGFARTGWAKGLQLSIKASGWRVPLVESRADGLRIHAELMGELVVGGDGPAQLAGNEEAVQPPATP